MQSDQSVLPNPQTEVPMSPDGYGYIYYSENSSVSSKICSVPLTPTSPMEVFHTPIFSPPSTPVIYTTPELPNIYIHPSPQIPLFTPPIDYVPQSPYCMVPSTPPSAPWYPHGINSQGFIFPTPVNTQTVPNRMQV